MGHFSTGARSLVVGTHTHVPTADHRILPGGTAYMTDVGMTGDYDSVIGMAQGRAARRFTAPHPVGTFRARLRAGTLSGIAVETDDATGLAVRVAPVRLGGRAWRRRGPRFWE